MQRCEHAVAVATGSDAGLCMKIAERERAARDLRFNSRVDEMRRGRC